MSSTQQLAAGYISDGDLLKSEAQTALEQIVSITKELFGGTEEGTAISIASGAFAVQANVSHYFIDTEAAAATDTLQYISGTPRAGQLIAIRSVNSARSITIGSGAGGAGQILTKNGSDFVLGYGQFAIFKYVSGSPGYWEEWLRDDLARIDQLLGARPATTLTVASSAVAASRARHLIDSTTTTNLDAITTANMVDGAVLFIMTANATYVRTMRHNITGTGKLSLIGGASIVMAANTHYGFVKNGSQWDHIMTLNAVPAGFSTIGAAGSIPYLSATDTPALLAPGTDGYVNTMVSGLPAWVANSSNSKLTPSAKSAAFTMTLDVHNTFHLITASSADIPVTVGASPADGTTYQEVIHSGAYKAVYTANGAELFYFGDHTDTVLNVVPGAAPVKLVAITGGWYVC